MRRTLVTGGAGFIGSHLARGLLRRGDRVRILDNFSTGKRENLAGMDNDLEILEGDLRDEKIVEASVRHVDQIFHLAAFISPPQSLLEPQTCYDINVHGTEILLEAARKAKVPRLLMASSAAVYGDSAQIPLRESGELNPLSPYAASKITNEVYAGMYSRALDQNITALRFFNIYGPRQSIASDYAAAIPIFTRQLLAGKPLTVFGDGKQTRDLVFVEDVVQANLLIADLKDLSGQVMNICTGRSVTLLDLVDELFKITGSRSEILFDRPRPGDIYHSVGDPRKLLQLTGFQPRVPLSEGLKHTVDWMQQQ